MLVLAFMIECYVLFYIVKVLICGVIICLEFYEKIVPIRGNKLSALLFSLEFN